MLAHSSPIYLEAVSELFALALVLEKADCKAGHAGNSGAISKCHNTADEFFKPNPSGPSLFSRISVLLVIRLAVLNYIPRALNCAKTQLGATVNYSETASNMSRRSLRGS